jgi:hypothetical protein
MKDVPLGEMTPRKLTVWLLLGYGENPNCLLMLLDKGEG